MNYEAERMVDQIVSGISRRKEPYGAICAGIDQKVCFITRGKSLEIIKLWIVSDGEFWDEKSFSGYLLLLRRKSGASRAAFALTDDQLNVKISSLDSIYDLTCLAICAASVPDKKTGIIPTLCLKARFTPQIGAVCLTSDNECISLFEYEGATMAGAPRRHEEIEERSDYYGSRQ